jgi:hypothetical protein
MEEMVGSLLKALVAMQVEGKEKLKTAEAKLVVAHLVLL